MHTWSKILAAWAAATRSTASTGVGAIPCDGRGHAHSQYHISAGARFIALFSPHLPPIDRPPPPPNIRGWVGDIRRIGPSREDPPVSSWLQEDLDGCSLFSSKFPVEKWTICTWLSSRKKRNVDSRQSQWYPSVTHTIPSKFKQLCSRKNIESYEVSITPSISNDSRTPDYGSIMGETKHMELFGNKSNHRSTAT